MCYTKVIENSSRSKQQGLSSHLKMMEEFLSKAKECLHAQRGEQMANLMALPVFLQFSAQDRALAHEIASKNAKDVARTVYKALQVDQTLSEVVSFRLLALAALVKEDFDDAYKNVHAAFGSILDFMGSNVDFPFLAGTLARLASDLRMIAVIADGSKAERERLSSQCLRECQNSITRAFTLVAKDRLPLTDKNCKKLYLFSITNTLFKIYFKLNTLQLMGKLIKLVDSPVVMNSLEAFSLCDVVTYKFYVGRLALFEDRYDEARQCLRFALQHTPQTPACLKNRQLILASLVPVEMCHGTMPTVVVGQQYGLQDLVDLGDAVQSGNLRAFNDIFASIKVVLIQSGTYLVVEQLKGLIYRNLFKKIHKITESTRLNLVAFQTACEWLGESLDLDEIECILANLIFENKVKGYLSHQKRILVVGKTDPFPVASIKRVRMN